MNISDEATKGGVRPADAAALADARTQVLAQGGASIGEIVTLTTATGARVTVCYCSDPEGNAIELQRWQAA